MSAETYSVPVEAEDNSQMLYSIQIQRLRNSAMTGGRGMAPQKCLPLPPFAPPPPFLLSSLSLSLIFTPQYSVQSGRESLTTGSQGARLEVLKSFLALTLVTEAVWLGGGAHRVDWYTRNTPHERIIITIIITISYIQDKPSCPKPTAKSICPAEPM